jgi:hypothetical protein
VFGKRRKDTGIRPMADAELCASVDKTRSRSGLGAVVAGDIAIASAVITAIILMSRGSGSSQVTAQIAAILGGGFTAIGTMTTAYFGIKSISNTASNIADRLHSMGAGGQPQPGQPQPGQPQPGQPQPGQPQPGQPQPGQPQPGPVTP